MPQVSKKVKKNHDRTPHSWGPEQRAKFKKTMKERHRQKNTKVMTASRGIDPVKEAIIYLKHAETGILNIVKEQGQRSLSQDRLYTLLALNCLIGK